MANSKIKKRVMSKQISTGMKRYWEEKKAAIAEAEEIKEQLAKKNIAISSLRDVARYEYKNLNPAMVSGALTSTKSGYLKQWSDFCEEMLETDAEMRGLIEARIRSVTGKKLIIEPADNSYEARLAAELVRENLENIQNFQQFLYRNMMAIFKGVSCHEIIYEYEPLSDKYVIKQLEPVMLSKLKIRLNPINEDGERVNTNINNGYGEWIYSYWDQGDVKSSEGIDIQRVFPGKFILHSPGNEELPHYRGLFRTLAWVWFFKRIGKMFWVSGAEKYAFPVVYATVPPGTSENVYNYLVQNLNNMANDAAAVFENTVKVESLSPGASGGDAVWKQLTDYLDKEMKILILGGTLVADAGASNSYALGTVHQENFFSLLQSDAQALSETMREQMIKPLLELNSHLFNGVVPPCPSVFFDVLPKMVAPIEEWHLRTGIVSVNELRESINLPLWTEEQGGNDVVKLIEDTVPASVFSITNGKAFENASTYYQGKEEEKELSLKKELEDPQSIAEFDDSMAIPLIEEEGGDE